MAKVAVVFPAANVALSPALRKQLQIADVLWMPSAIIAHTKLTPGAKFLYSVLLNQSWRQLIVCPTHGALARETGASVRATRNYIDELTRANLIAVQPRPGKPSVYMVARD